MHRISSHDDVSARSAARALPPVLLLGCGLALVLCGAVLIVLRGATVTIGDGLAAAIALCF